MRTLLKAAIRCVRCHDDKTWASLYQLLDRLNDALDWHYDGPEHDDQFELNECTGEYFFDDGFSWRERIDPLGTLSMIERFGGPHTDAYGHELLVLR